MTKGRTVSDTGPRKISFRRPDVVEDGDQLSLTTADEQDYRVPFTFIEASNQGTLFERSDTAFEDAARAHELFEIVNTRTDNLIGTCIVQAMADQAERSYEVGGLMIHPAARRSAS